jgi:hypothetical protein
MTGYRYIPALGLFYYKGYCASKSRELTYDFSTTDTAYSFKFQNNANVNGLLQNIIVQETGDNAIYTYY